MAEKRKNFRKNLEEELLKTRRLLKASLESSHDSIHYSIDTNYKYLFFNSVHVSGMKHAYGTDIAIGLNLLECITVEEDRKKAEVNHNRALAGESHSTIEIYGDEIKSTYETYFKPIYDEPGNVVGATIFSRDISNLSRVEQMLEELPIGYNLLDMDGNVLFVNAIGRDYFGVSKNDPLNNYRFFDDALITDEIKSSVKNGHAAVEERFIDFSIINKQKMYESSRSDKDELFLRITYTPYNASHNATAGFMVITEDLTEHKMIEAELLESRELLDATQALSHAGGWAWDVNHEQMNWTNETYRLHDMSKDEIGDGSEDLIKIGSTCYNSGDRQRILDAFRRCADSGESYDMEIPFTTAKGRELWVRTTAKAEYTDGRITRVIGNLMDITERKELQEKLAHSQKMDSIGQLAGGIAHNFNNVLCGIMNAAQLLRFPARNLDDKGLKYTDMILKSSQRASELVATLLTFGQKRQISFIPFQMDEVLHDTVNLISETLDKNISSSLSEKALCSRIFGDRAELENALINLCINAGQAMKHGGEIRILTENVLLDQEYCNNSFFDIKAGDYFKIAICDTGSGISGENLQKIFEPFFTTKDQGEASGLGLAAVYGIIQEHHGEILVKSELGKGTSFYLLFPCFNDQHELNRKKLHRKKGSHRGTILLVDDEDLNRTLGAEILEMLGYKVLLAENGGESLELFKEKQVEIDLVILDMIMPDMNGAEVFYQMKEIEENCKVIISSGYTKDENISSLMENGLLDFLQKPYKIDEIKEKISSALNGLRDSKMP